MARPLPLRLRSSHFLGLLALLVIAVLLTLLFRLGSPAPGPDGGPSAVASGHGYKIGEPDHGNPDGAENPDAPSTRKRERSTQGAEEAKLRSLLELREGEISVISLSPATVAKPEISAPVTDPSSNAPTLAGFYRQEELTPLLLEEARKGTAFSGQLNPTDGPLDWQNRQWQVSGQIMASSTGPVYQLKVLEGGSELLTTVSSFEGRSILLLSSGPEPEGLLLVSKNARKAEKGDSPQPPSPELR